MWPIAPAVLAVALLCQMCLAQTTLPNAFRWQTTGPIISAPAGADYYALKDPSIVFHGGKYHLFCTVRGKQRTHAIVYLAFPDFASAGAAKQTILPNHPGFFCAPQVFYFAPHQRWYLICQATDLAWGSEKYRPAYATSTDIADPARWSGLKPLFPAKPAGAKAWLDFWVICDGEYAYCFFTSLDGKIWRGRTKLADFPAGFASAEVALEDDLFEASHTYRIKGSGQYLTVVEAQGDQGTRYYKAYIADRLDGAWKPLAATRTNPFAAAGNLKQPAPEGTDVVSHTELLRTNADQTPEIDLSNLQFLAQGCLASERTGKGYGQFPWSLFLIQSR